MTPKQVKLVRTVSQVVFFLLLVVVLTGAFCAVRLGGSANLTCSLGMLQLTLGAREVLWGTVISGSLLLIVTVLLGRVFCGWVCPFGAVLDWLDKPLSRLRLARNKVPPALLSPDNRHIKYGVLGGALLAAGILHYPAFCALCPVGTTCRTAGLQGLNIGLETAVLPLAASLDTVRKRFWCKVLCPIGALLGLFSRFSLLKIRLPWDRCTGCNRCEQACAMDNRPHQGGHDRLKTDPAVLTALVDLGVPDLLDRPGRYEDYPQSIKDLLKQKMKSLAVDHSECSRCYSCLAVCPVTTREAAPSVAVQRSGLSA